MSYCLWVGSWMNLFSWIDELFVKKRPWDSFSAEDKKKFSPFMVNRYLSMNNDFLPIVNHFQKLTIEVMPIGVVYKFYCSLLPNKKTFLRYLSERKPKQTKRLFLSYKSILRLVSYRQVNTIT